MADPSVTSSIADREDGFDAILVLILEAEDARQPYPPEYWFARFPDYRADLVEYFADRDAVVGTCSLPAHDFPGYEIVRELGRGGMGVVYEARQLDPPRIVALKVLQTARLRTPVERVRFRREARVAARLDHPGIVPVYTIGEAGGVPFYTMRLAPDGPLSQALGRFQTDLRAAAQLVADLSRAVHFAHQRCILHRDLKPSNILLDGDHGLVGDFGLVRDFSLVRDLADSDPLTGTTELVGTPAYMAPEQTEGKAGAVTVATDVYGLGAVLYACLTGRPPFVGSSPMDILVQVRTNDPVPSSRINPRIPRDLDAISRKCIEKDPARRYPSADALADDLGRFLRHEPVRAKPIGPARRAARWVARHPLLTALTFVAALAVVAAAGLGVSAWDRGRELRLAQQDADRQRFFAGLERVRMRRGDPYASWTQQSLADLRELALLPSARDHLADLRTEAAAALAADGLEPGRLLADFEAYAAHFSADGQWLAVASWKAEPSGRVELTDRKTGARRNLSFPANADWVRRDGAPDGARSVRFSPDSQWLAVGTRSGWVVRWDMRRLDAKPLSWPAHAADDLDTRLVAVTTLGFRVDSRTLLSGGHRAIRGWTIADSRATGLELKGSCLPLDFYPVEDELTVYTSDGRTDEYKLLRLSSGKVVPDSSFEGSQRGCLGPDPWLMAYQPDSRTGLSVRHAHPWSRPRPLQGWENQPIPKHLAFSPAGDLLAAVYEHDLQLRVWDVASGALVAERTTDKEATHAAFSPAGDVLVVTGLHGARAYAVRRGPRSTVAVVPESEARAMAALADHSAVSITAKAYGITGRVYTFPLTLAALPIRPAAPELDLTSFHDPFDVSPDGRDFVISGTYEGTHKVVVDPTGASARFPAPEVNDIRFGPDGRRWVLENHHLWAWPATGGVVVWRNDDDSKWAGKALKCMAPGSRTILIGRRDGRVIQLDPAGTELAVWDVMPSAVLGIAISADESRALVGGERGEVRLIDLATGAITVLVDAHRASVHSVAFGPAFFVTGAADRRVRLWTLAGELIATLEAAGPVQKVLVSNDGSSLLIHVRGERAVRRWQLDVLFREWAALGIGLPER